MNIQYMYWMNKSTLMDLPHTTVQDEFVSPKPPKYSIYNDTILREQQIVTVFTGFFSFYVFYVSNILLFLKLYVIFLYYFQHLVLVHFVVLFTHCIIYLLILQYFTLIWCFVLLGYLWFACSETSLGHRFKSQPGLERLKSWKNKVEWWW